MKILRFVLVALVVAGVSHARPFTVEESARLTPPDSTWEYLVSP